MSATRIYATGTTVCLKSGGPVMTVQKMTGQKVFCVWYEDGFSEYSEADFLPDMLVEVEVVEAEELVSDTAPEEGHHGGDSD